MWLGEGNGRLWNPATLLRVIVPDFSRTGDSSHAFRRSGSTHLDGRGSRGEEWVPYNATVQCSTTVSVPHRAIEFAFIYKHASSISSKLKKNKKKFYPFWTMLYVNGAVVGGGLSGASREMECPPHHHQTIYRTQKERLKWQTIRRHFWALSYFVFTKFSLQWASPNLIPLWSNTEQLSARTVHVPAVSVLHRLTQLHYSGFSNVLSSAAKTGAILKFNLC